MRFYRNGPARQFEDFVIVEDKGPLFSSRGLD
jgi:hypothetical protein